MLIIKEVNSGEKKAYVKPEIEITVFQMEDICFESGILGDAFGMDGMYME
jgi:hypothetical protein